MTAVLVGIDSTELMKRHARVVAKAWADPEFESALRGAPHAVLSEYGIDIPTAVAIRFVADRGVAVSVDGDTVEFALPSAPTLDLGDEVLSGEASAQGRKCAHTTNTTACGPANTTGNPRCGGPCG